MSYQKKFWTNPSILRGPTSHLKIWLKIQRKWQENRRIFVLAITFKPLLQFTNGFCAWSAFLLFFKKTPIMAIFIAMTRLAIMAKMTKMAIIAVMEYYKLASNMAFMGVFLKNSKNADQTWKWFVNWGNGLKVMAKTKISQIFWPFPLYFEPKFQLACGTPWDAWICLEIFLVAHLRLWNGIR